MPLQELLTFFGVPTGTILLLSLVEISPIKINPWSALFNAIGKRLNQSTNERLDTIEKNSDKLQKDLSNHIVQSQRRIILDFADSCRIGRKHSKEQFDYTLVIYGEYETYIENNHMKNGQVDEAIRYIREIYQAHLHENDFL